MSFIFSHEFIGAAALALGIYSYIPYFLGIYKRTTKPHIFSWLIWGLLTAIAWAAQVHENAGPGAWITGFTAIVCFSIVFASLRFGEKTITRSDWITFLAALMSIPLWYFTKDPFWSVILISLIDALAFYPTFRKSWAKPGEEVAFTYSLSSLKFGLSLFAIENFTFTASFYPISLVIMNGAFVIMLLARRKMLNV